MLKKLMKGIGEFRGITIATPLFILGEAVIECIIPFIIAKLVNDINAGCEYSVIVKRGASLFVFAVLSLACGAAAAYTASKSAAGFARNLRRMMFYNVQRFSFSNIDKFSSSSLVTRMTTDVESVRFAFMMIIRGAVRAPLMFIFSIIMAYIMGGRLSLMFVVVVPVMLGGLLLIGYKALPSFRRVFKKYDKLNESIEENVMAARSVKGFAREEYEKDKFAHASDAIRREFTRAERIVALNGPLMQTCLYANMIAVLTLGSYIIISSSGADLGVGELSGMLTYGFQILMSLMMLSIIFVMVTMSAEGARRIVEVLDEEPSITNPENPVPGVADGSVDFSGVSFKYAADGERYALDGVNLHIDSGETVGILGDTGSAKSTLVMLIPRLYDPTVGSVRVGGVDCRDYDLTVLRDSVSMVLQNNVLFSGTIAENLRWGNENATDEEIRAAASLAQADEFINTFPEGYDTYIEQGGANVSGGQKQRLCIARALLKKPKILILDDSTSAVDTRTDALIRKGFREFIPETTKIIIAQRVASVQDADKIIIMHNGHIEDMGTHDELMESSQTYREIFEEQTRGGDSDA